MKIYIQGATGYLGSYLTKQYLGGAHEVIGITRNKLADKCLKQKMKWLLVSDLVTTTLCTPFKEDGLLINVATCHGRNNESVLDMEYSNVLLPLEILKKASFQYGIRHFIYAGTVLPSDVNIYAFTKRKFIEESREFCIRNGVKFINIVTDQIYGPGNAAGNFISQFIENCMNPNIKSIDLTFGLQKRDFIYIDDLVSAYEIIIANIDALDNYQEIQVGSDSPVTLRQFTELVARATNTSAALNYGAIPYRKNELMNSQLNTKIIRELGWKQKIGMKDGVQKIIDSKKHLI
ncbi:NAD(P)-dependent oxidoreductase [Polynucleobacter paneuropaeus]|nr:NAD(P)-dependent oxidoreductase [Polynucleobacter paneuropaeus]